MRIIIAGAGEVGFHLTKLLAGESQDIVLIDTEDEKLKYAQDHLDVITIKGSATSISTLTDANVSKADLFLAVTASEETNITSSTIAKKLGAKKTIARISNTEFIDNINLFNIKSLGIDELISPERLAAKEIERLLKNTAFTDSFEFDEGKLSLIGIHVQQNAPIIGKSIMEMSNFNVKNNFITVAIHRHGDTIIPRGNTEFELGDHVYFITKNEGIDEILKICNKINQKINRVMILGGSKTGLKLAKLLDKKYKIKIIEKDTDKCFQLADELPNVLVVNGDCTNVELLEEEGINTMDAFISVTGNSETNILSALVAKNRKVRKTIALVENIDYIHLTMDIGIDSMINKKLIAANSIFRYVRQGKVISITGIHGVDAEILEFEVRKDSKILSKPLKDLDFPNGAIVGGVIRNNSGHIALGNFQIQENDHVVVFCMPDCIHKVETFFK